MEKEKSNDTIVGAPLSDPKKTRTIAIKEMCQKFENLSEGNSTNASETNGHRKVQQLKRAMDKTIDADFENGVKFRESDKSDRYSINRKEKGGTLHQSTIISNGMTPVNKQKIPSKNTVNLAIASEVPIAPVRKSKCKSLLSYLELKDKLNKESVCVRMCEKASSENGKKLSVRERTKLFEKDFVSDVPLKLSSRTSPNLSIHDKVSVNPKKNKAACQKGEEICNVSGSNDFTQHNSKKSQINRFLYENLEVPPSKPPRSVARHKFHSRSPNGKAQSRFSEIGECGKFHVLPKQIRSVSLIDCNKSNSPKTGTVTSFGSESESPSRKDKLSILGSMPPKVINDEKESSVKSPKGQTGLTNKTHSIVNYFKNLSSTANNLCDKVKLKQSIFVDLTPTTVSPPKHYGTLKKSHSEEHIYAEAVFPSPFLEKPDCDAATVSPASCMETLADEVKTNRLPCSKNLSLINGNGSSSTPCHGRKFGMSSVRNMIYESFSAHRNCGLYKEGDTHDDTESDVSAQDIQERIIYVRSVKKQVSVSSLCIAPKLFETVMIIGILENEPCVLLQFPQKPKQGFDYPLLPHICFPDIHLLKPTTAYKSETFYFTLVDGEDEKMFGYCHRILGWPGGTRRLSFACPCAICILSTISAPVFYKKILNEIEKHLVLPVKQCTEYIASLQKVGIPNAGASLSITDITELDGTTKVVIARPLDFHAVSINLTRVLQLLDHSILLKAVASLVLERRVLLLSKYSSNIFQCCEAISSLLYPFHWQHLIIPVLPKCLLVQTCTDSPYLLGVINTDDNQVLDLLAEHQVLIIDLDEGSVIKSYEDEDSILPKKIQKAVVIALSLAKNMTDPTEMLRDLMISEAFVHMFVEIVGHYEEFITVQEDGSLVMQKETFQKNPSSRGVQSFLQWFSETLMFDVFIEECIWRKSYRDICQTQNLTYFEKRVEEYKWELACENEKLSKIIGKTVKNFSEKLKMLKSF